MRLGKTDLLCSAAVERIYDQENTEMVSAERRGAEMTKEDWEYAEKELSGIFGKVDLIVDNYNVTIECRLDKTRHYTPV